MSPRPSVGRRAQHLLLAALLAPIALLGVVACDAGNLRDRDAASDPPEVTDRDENTRGERSLVRVLPIRTGAIRSQIETSSDVEAEEWADLHAQTVGFVERLHVEEGDSVQAGHILAELDDDELTLRLDVAQLKVTEMQQESDRQEAAIKELERKLDQQRLLEARTRAEYQRLETIPEGVLSVEELDQKRYLWEDAKIACEAGVSALRQSTMNRKVTGVRLEQAKVDRDIAQLTLDHTRIRAPIEGVVSERSIRVGERIGQQTKAFTIVNPKKLITYAHIPQKEIRFLRPGQASELTCDAIPGAVFTGSVRTVSPVIERESGTVKTTLEVVDPEGALRPGMFVTIRIILDIHPDALLVPKKAILHESDRPFVFLVANGIAKKVFFRPGYSDRDFIEALDKDGDLATSGLVSGARVVVRGQEKLTDGSPVEVEGGRAPDTPEEPSGAEPGS